MLVRSDEVVGARIGALDGAMGYLADLYFDDQTWKIRYLVVDAGHRLSHRKVLISPVAVTGIRSTPQRVLELNLTRQQIGQGPPVEAHPPVWRQLQARHFESTGWPYYWRGGPVAVPGAWLPDAAALDFRPVGAAAVGEDAHLCSANVVARYRIYSLDHSLGRIEGFLVDDTTWAIRYLVASTHRWWPGKRILLAVQWISAVSWPESRVYVDLDRDAVKSSPDYVPSLSINREYETRLFEHYGRQPYWMGPPATSLAA